MSKYEPLWKYIKAAGAETQKLTFGDIERIVGFPVDHSFLTYKKELLEYGYQVRKISQKAQNIIFGRKS